jgi:serine phosphatase RsbU (regulator of sigma subunit)
MATAASKPITEDLVIDSPHSARTRIHLESDRYRLGRAASNEIAFPADGKLSREHLVFERVDRDWTLTDLSSRNGTFVNGKRVTDRTRLAHGDLISAGHLSIRYDTCGEFTDFDVTDVQFVEQELAPAKPTVLLDLKSAIEKSTDVAGRPTLQDSHLGTLVRVARELAGQTALDKLFDLVLNSSLEAVKASRGIAMTRGPNGELVTRAVRGDGFRISSRVRELVMTEGRSLLVPDARSHNDFGSRTSIVSQEVRSFLAVPLQTDESVIGLLYLDSWSLVREFTAEDLNLVTVMANIAAIRIEHARLIQQEEAKKLLDRDLERAAEIQRGLLPTGSPEIVGFDLAGYNVPCRTVGGDYYDFLPYVDGRVALLIGDVSGKGLGAALLMSSLQARSQVFFEMPENLAMQVSRLNRSVAANCPGNCFITFFIAVLNPGSGELTYCNAGHNPPLLVRRQGHVEALEASGIPLGINKNAAYEEDCCCLESGDRLVLFSDGVTEAHGTDENDDFGEQRLISVVEKGRDLSAEGMVQAIRTELVSFLQGIPSADDITLVVACRK